MANNKPILTLDFETEAIEPRPHYPPKPVGVALRTPKWKRARYLSWGHPGYNNSTRNDARRIILELLRDHVVLCHHAGFDLDILETHLGIPWPSEHHDTLLLAFLVDPDSSSLSLKPLAERYLGEPPSEQEMLHDWILANVKEATRKTAGAYIAKAPAELVAPYAIGDVDRTYGLFQYFMAELRREPRLIRAYQRELKVTRTLIKMERRGIPIRTGVLEKDIKRYEKTLEEIEIALLRKLKVRHPKEARAEFSWSGKNFANLLLKSGLVKELPMTEKGNASVSAESLATVMPKKLAHEFEVRSQIAVCLQTFMRPWMAQTSETGGTFHVKFNQVRGDYHGGSAIGARTGRLSSSPNFQNVIRGDKDARVPKLRDYVGRGRFALLGQRDASQQELRITAEYEDGPFKAAYLKNPRQDGHTMVGELIRETTGIVLDRYPVKTINFAILYGAGINKLAAQLGVSKEEAKRLLEAHRKALPGIPALQRALKERAMLNEPIFTWGGRRYYCEKPRMIDGRLRTFEYKMLNVLVQGSAADCTKQAMVNYDSLGAFAEENPMLLQVHDELIFGIFDKRIAREAQRRVREAFADLEDFSIPMLSDGKIGAVSWQRMKKIPKSWEE